MIMKLFCVFDAKGAFYTPPFPEIREETAIRKFSDSVNDPRPGNNWASHPEDYSLFYVGEFDDSTATFKPCTAVALVTAAAVKTFREKMEVVN